MVDVIHITPGLLDVRGFTILGLHAKPNSKNPIGKFGSGLKYAIATLLRLECSIRVFIGKTEYEFYTSQGDFRGVDYKQLRMKKREGFTSRWRYIELPFTMEFGKFWKSWQAYRELESNTRDESGETFLGEFDQSKLRDDYTTIVVSGRAYEEAYMERDKVFLPNALTVREGDERVQVFNEPSKHLYWRGVRVFDLEKPSVYTYNILDDMELTEDRTLKYMWDAQSKIAAYVARSKDHKLINAVVSADAEKFFEGRLDWDYAYTTPSESFKEVLSKKKSRGGYIAPRALLYYNKYTPVVSSAPQTTRDRIAHWAYEGSVPQDLRLLLQHLLKCKIEEPSADDEMPF